MTTMQDKQWATTQGEQQTTLSKANIKQNKH
jgi:hypothetical protein